MMPVRVAERLVDFRRTDSMIALPVISNDTSGVGFAGEDVLQQDDDMVRDAAAPVEGQTDENEHAAALLHAEADWRAERQVLETAFEERLAQAHGEWAQQCADTICLQIEESFKTLHDMVLTTVRDKAAPVFEDLVRRGAVEAMAEMVERLRRDAVRIEISGPEHLVTALKRCMREAGDGVRIGAAKHSELRLETDVCVAETCIEEWLRSWKSDAA